MKTMVDYGIEYQRGVVQRSYAQLILQLEELRKREIAAGRIARTTAVKINKLKSERKYHYKNASREKIIALKDEELEALVQEAEKHWGYDIREQIRIGLIEKKGLQRAIIKQKYILETKKGIRNGGEIKKELADCYGLTKSGIEKIIYRK